MKKEAEPEQHRKLRKALTQGERVVFFSKISRRSRISHYIGIAALLAAGAWLSMSGLEIPYASVLLIGAGLACILCEEVSLFGHRFYVTNMAITERKGIISKKVTTVDMEDILNITISQSALQRLLGYGSLHVNTADESVSEEIVFPSLARPSRVKKLVEEHVRKRDYYKGFDDEVPKEKAGK